MGSGKGKTNRISSYTINKTVLEPIKVAPFYKVEITDPDTNRRDSFTMANYNDIRDTLLYRDHESADMPIEEDASIPDVEGEVVGRGYRDHEKDEFVVTRSAETEFDSSHPEKCGLNIPVVFDVEIRDPDDDEADFYFNVISFWTGKDGRLWIAADANHYDFNLFEEKNFPTDFTQVKDANEAIEWVEKELSKHGKHNPTNDFYSDIRKMVFDLRGMASSAGSLKPDINF